MNTELIKTAKRQRGHGWLGAMQLVDALDSASSTNRCANDVKLRMEHEVGRQILSGNIGCDESAMRDACNYCIEAAIQLLLDLNGPVRNAATDC